MVFGVVFRVLVKNEAGCGFIKAGVTFNTIEASLPGP
jgi:hypothetical protein